MIATYGLKRLLDMYELDAAAYHGALNVLNQLTSLPKERPDMAAAYMTAPAKQQSREMLSALVKALGEMNVPVTRETVNDLREEISDARSIRYGDFAQLVLNLNNTLRRELKAVRVFVLDGKNANYYEPAAPLFGADVAKNFPSLAYEIDQAGKCFACDLTTASAFHSIRCLEAALRAITRCLGIPDPTKGKDRNWGNINASIKSAVDNKWPASTGRMSGDAKLFDEIYGALGAMQNPYRNATMHLDAKYTAQEALHVLEVVKGLLSKVASRMDENGTPLA